MRKKPVKGTAEQGTKIIDEFKNKGIKVIGWYWTLGRYDVAVIFEAANEKEALKFSISVGDIVASETLVAIPREEEIKLL
jgi:uncharacterized protein with GYD domain